MNSPHAHTDAQILAGMSAAISAGDMPAVVSLLRLLALQAPAKAQAIYDAIVHRTVTVTIDLAPFASTEEKNL